jgi:hypothetical protein
MSIEQVSALMATAQAAGEISPADFAAAAMAATDATAKPKREPPPVEVAVPQCAMPLEPNTKMLNAAKALGHGLSNLDLAAIYKAMIAARS